MATTHTDISYTSTTQTGTNAGFGIRCDNEDIYCDSEDYYCDGSVVQKDIGYTSTTHTDIGY